MIKALPYLLLIIGILSLFIIQNIYAAGACIILGIVMIIEKIWKSVKDE